MNNVIDTKNLVLDSDQGDVKDNLNKSTGVDVTRENVLSIKDDLKQVMLAKLSPSERWSYTAIFDKDKGGPITPDEKAAKIAQMKSFIEGPDFEKFIEKTANVLSNLSKEDTASLGTANPSKGAQALLGLISDLESKGFPMTDGKPINFWSGTEGRKQAFASPTLSDSDCPALCVLFDVCEKVQKIEAKQSQSLDDRHLYSLLPQALSKVYASYATGQVNVYMASDKGSELSGLTSDNNFGEAELGTLQSLLQSGKIQGISVHTYKAPGLERGPDGKAGTLTVPGSWKDPVELNSKNADDLLKIIRRTPYEANWDPTNKHGLKDADKTVFPPTSFNKGAFESFQKSEPRSAINLGRLRNMAVEWRSATIEAKVKLLAEDIGEAVKKGSIDGVALTTLNNRIAECKTQIGNFTQHGGKAELKTAQMQQPLAALNHLSSQIAKVNVVNL